MNYLLDTTVLIDALRGRGDRKRLLAELVVSGHTLATSALNVGEVFAGMRPGEEAKTELFLANLEVFPITPAIARRGGGLKAEWSRKGKTFSLADMFVAATAMEQELVLMTENHKDFRMIRGLALYGFN